MNRRVPVSRVYLKDLLQRVDQIDNKVCGGGLSKQEQQLRNKALISLLYLSGRRVSEITGRKEFTRKEFMRRGKLVEAKTYPKIEGLHQKHILSDLKEAKRRYGVDVLPIFFQILKKKKFMEQELLLDLADTPFITYILQWLEYCKYRGWGKIFSLTQPRVYQILKQLDPAIIGAHWFRHQRMSHLAESLNPYQLTEQIGFWEDVRPASSYVHGRTSDYLDAVKKARESHVQE